MTIPKLTKRIDVDAVLQSARDQSEKTLQILRSVAVDVLGSDPDLIIGVNGSVARREVTAGSDVDLFVLTLSGDISSAKAAQTKYRERLSTHDIKMPADGGVFQNPLRTYISRRMLYLLEGEWVANEDSFNRLRLELVGRYVPDEIEEQKIVRFFLNDVIRYWRTICVDFEYKTADATKPRAIRLVKLRLSRMLLYVAGIAAARETVGLSASEKREKLAELLSLPPLERLTRIHGSVKMMPVEALYATFLSAINDQYIRSKLELPGIEGLSTPEFTDLSNVAREFKTALLALLDLDAGDDPLMEALLL